MPVRPRLFIGAEVKRLYDENALAQVERDVGLKRAIAVVTWQADRMEPPQRPGGWLNPTASWAEAVERYASRAPRQS